MIRKNEEKTRVDFQNRFGGEGTFEVTHILNPEEMMGKGRLFADNTLAPGASLGTHEHNGDFEAYYFLEGEGLYSGPEGDVIVKAGDVTVVDDHGSHSIRNTGDTDLRFIALILYT